MLEEKILNDYKEALKQRDTLRSSTLSFLRAEMMNAAVEKKKKLLDDDDTLAVIRKQIKQRQDSIEQFEKGSRRDLADKEIREREILKAYLPAQLPEEELRKIIEEVIIATGAQGAKDMGMVMKEVKTRVAQSADGKLVSDLVKKRLFT